MLASSNYRYKILFLIMPAIFLIASSAFGQIHGYDTLFIGNSDGSPFHVPYQGVVDMPVWATEIYNWSSGMITLTTLNYAVSERLGGNFHYPWNFMFSDPFYFPDHSKQALGFFADNPPNGLIHLADFSFRMNIDPSYINDTLQIMYAMSQFFDSTGYNHIYYVVQVSHVIIDNVTSTTEYELKPDNFALSQNYPNPFNASTTIEFSLPEESAVELVVYDLLGRKVATLAEGVKTAGIHTIIWTADDVPSGVYFARLETKNTAKNVKMVLLK